MLPPWKLNMLSVTAEVLTNVILDPNLTQAQKDDALTAAKRLEAADAEFYAELKKYIDAAHAKIAESENMAASVLTNMMRKT